jgi:hypothetical protein
MRLADDEPRVERMRETHPVRFVRDILTVASTRSHDECHPHVLTFVTTGGVSSRIYSAHEGGAFGCLRMGF